MQRRRELVPERGLSRAPRPFPSWLFSKLRTTVGAPNRRWCLSKCFAVARKFGSSRSATARPRVQRARRVLRPPKRNAPARLRHRGERDRGGARGTPPTRTVHHLFRLHLVRDVARASDPAAVKPRPGEVARPPRDEDDVERAPKQREPPRLLSGPCTSGTNHLGSAAGPRARRRGRERCAFHANMSSKSSRRDLRGVRRRRRSWPARRDEAVRVREEEPAERSTRVRRRHRRRSSPSAVGRAPPGGSATRTNSRGGDAEDVAAADPAEAPAPRHDDEVVAAEEAEDAQEGAPARDEPRRRRTRRYRPRSCATTRRR